MKKPEPRGRIPQLYRDMRIGQQVVVNYKGGPCNESCKTVSRNRWSDGLQVPRQNRITHGMGWMVPESPTGHTTSVRDRTVFHVLV